MLRGDLGYPRYTRFLHSIIASSYSTTRGLKHGPKTIIYLYGKDYQLYHLSEMKMPEYKLQLTIHGVIAARGLAAEAAPFGEALWL